jgi:hypothetical protein
MTTATGKPRALAVLLVAAAAMSVTACDGVDGHPHPPVSATSTVSSTTGAAPPHLTLAELAQHPCRALDQKQMADLGVTDNQPQEGGEQETGFRQCRWQTARASLLFGAHPSADMTRDPQIAQLEPGQLDGHRTMLGVNSALDRCMMYVAVHDQQSFQVAIFPREGQHLGTAGCDTIKQLATAILHNLT